MRGLSPFSQRCRVLFGILKGRFRILETAILYKDPKEIDNVYSTCCILHNMLLSFDGLDKLEEDVDWKGAGGSTDKDVGPLPEDTTTTGEGGGEEKVELKATIATFRNALSY